MRHLAVAAMMVAALGGPVMAGGDANDVSDLTSPPAPSAVEDPLTAADPEEPAGGELTGGEWVVEDIGGAGVIDGAPASLLFGADGSLSGSGTCNRLIGSYTASDGVLSIEPLGTTRMACPEALMAQEGRLLDLLAQVTGYRIDDTGALVLTIPDGAAILARR